ncbi:MAG: AAA family ATPase [bacterium]|nr:AAA family ATPase [bacterium]
MDGISIRGYKSIRSLERLPLESLNILIGANGAGKSNFISIFSLLQKIIEGNQRVSGEFYIKLWFGENGYECSLIPAADDRLIFAEENILFNDRSQKLGSGHKESLLPESSASEKGITSHVLEAIKGWRVYHFHDTSDSAKMKQINDIHDNIFLKPHASNLAAFLYLLKETEKEYYNNIVDTIKMVIPFFDDFILRPSPFNANNIRLEWKEKGSDSYFDAHSFSDGTLRFICLATLLLQPKKPAMILLDEPELGLHPYAITILTDLLRSASVDSQVIVSTQSVTLVNHFAPQDIIIVDKKENHSVFERPTSETVDAWIDDYSLGELWEKNVIGGRPVGCCG